ncbi:MAG: DUF484 family protein [Desulfovibrionales bacterium]
MKEPLESEFLATLTELEIYAQRGDGAKVRELVNVLSGLYQRREREVHSLVRERERFCTEVARLEALTARLRASIESAAADYQNSLFAFEKFRSAITTINTMRSLQDLPEALERVRDLLRLQDVRMVLDQGSYADFLPQTIPVLTKKELERHCDGLFSDGERIRLGRWTEHAGAEVFQARFPAGLLETGSCFLYRMEDKYAPGTSIGVLGLFDQDPGRYTRDKATDFLGHFCDVLACTVVTVREHEKLEREKVIDPLTGVYNREYLYRHAPRILQFANRREFPVCLLFIDLNNFKQVNDTLGHDVGDRLLMEVAERIRKSIRQYDIFVRFGGDEFVLLLPDTDRALAGAIGKRIKGDLQEIQISAGGADRLHISAAVGISSHVRGKSLEELLQEADQDMYRKKKRSRERAGRDC